MKIVLWQCREQGGEWVESNWTVGGFNYRPYKPLERVGQVDSQVIGRHWRASVWDDSIKCAFLSITSYWMKNGLEKGEHEGKEAVVVIQGRDVGAEGTKRNGWSPGKTRITGSDDRSCRRGVLLSPRLLAQAVGFSQFTHLTAWPSHLPIACRKDLLRSVEQDIGHWTRNSYLL